MKNLVSIVLGAFCVLYIANLGCGFLEFIPDNIPIVGNLDDASAGAILVACIKNVTNNLNIKTES